MAYDVVDHLERLFGGGPVPACGAVVGEPVPTVVDDALDVAADPLAGTPFANWVRRPDCHGRMGWEAPDLPEWQRWWARGDFDDLPSVPEVFRLGASQAPAYHDCARCVSAGMVDTQDLCADRADTGHVRGPDGM